MEEGSISGSLDRIEAAIARIEAAAHQRQTPDSNAPDADLERRYAALKSSVAGTLARLDALIEQQS